MEFFSRCSYGVISPCCMFASQGISLCFTVIKITKRHNQDVTKTSQKFLQSRFFVCFWKFLLKYEKFFKLGSRKFHFLKYKELFKSVFFYFSSSESYFMKFFSLVVRKFRFPKYKKLPFLKYEEFFSG